MHLLLKAENKKGNGIKELGEKGRITIYTDNFQFTIDNFVGFGTSYKQRIEPLIEITIDGHSKTLSLTEFVEKIKK